jgi:hypothetical protein
MDQNAHVIIVGIYIFFNQKKKKQKKKKKYIKSKKLTTCLSTDQKIIWLSRKSLCSIQLSSRVFDVEIDMGMS